MKRVPKLLKHSSGQGRVILNGKVFYLGKLGSPECHQRYDDLIEQWVQNGRQPVQAGTTFADLVERYKRYLDSARRYRKGNERTSQWPIVRKALDQAVESFGRVHVAKLTEAHMIRHRDRLEEHEHLTCTGINRKVRLILQCLRWARQRGLLPKPVWADCSGLEPLRMSECGDRGAKRPKRAVTIAEVELVVPHVPRAVAAMLRLQALTGMRPGEVCSMRWSDIDRTAPVVVGGVAMWVYSVGRGENEHHGRQKSYMFNPSVQSLLAEFSGVDTAFVFSPRAQMGEWSRKRRADRQSKVTDYTKRRDARSSRRFADRYSSSMYRQAVKRGCLAAGVQPFTPGEVKHGVDTFEGNALLPILSGSRSGYLYTDRHAVTAAVHSLERVPAGRASPREKGSET